jgi:hypothetical protein
MNVGEVYDLFRSLVDEPDETFLSVDNTQTYLHAGHLEYRSFITDINPEIFSSRIWIVPTSREFELAGTVFSSAAAAAPAADQAERLIRLGLVDSQANDSLSYYLTPCQTPVGLENAEGDYCLVGTKLIFIGSMSGSTIRIEYVRVPAIVKTGWLSTSNVFIDNLPNYHPLIALYAARYYAIRDGASNPALLAQLDIKERELRAFLATGRLTDSAQYISPQINYSNVVTI